MKGLCALLVVILSLWGGAALAQASYRICDCEDAKEGVPCPDRCREPPKLRYKFIFAGTPPTDPTLPPLSSIVPQTGPGGSTAARTAILEVLRKAAEAARENTEKDRVLTEDLWKKGKLDHDKYMLQMNKYNHAIGGYKQFIGDYRTLNRNQ